MLPIDNPTNPNERNAKLICKTFDKLQPLINSCKKNNTTIHSAIVTALAISQGKLIKQRKNINDKLLDISVNTPVDLRGLSKRLGMNHNSDSTLINCISVPFTNVIVDTEFTIESFWNSAREYKRILENEIMGGNLVDTHKLGRRNFEDSPQDLFELMCPDVLKSGGRTSNLNVSNLGTLDGIFGENIDALCKLENIYGASYSLNWGDCVYVLVCSLSGKMHFSFAFCSIYRKETISDFADDAIEMLTLLSN